MAGEDDGIGGVELLHLAQHLQAVHAGHLDVRDHDVGQLPAVELQSLGP